MSDWQLALSRGCCGTVCANAKRVTNVLSAERTGVDRRRGFVADRKIISNQQRHESRRNSHVGHPLSLLRIIFGVLVTVLVVAGLTTRARPLTPREWMLVRVLIVFLAWALLGLGWLGADEVTGDH